MAEKKFSGADGSVSLSELNTDYESAKVFDKLRVGRHGVYFRDGFKNRFIAYNAMERVFIRIQEVNGRMCCGNTILQYFRLVFVKGGKEFADFISEKEPAMDEALALIHEMAPDVAIGVPAKT